MRSKLITHKLVLLPLVFASLAVVSPPVSGQVSADDPPVTYEVQIDGESFQVEGNQRPVKVESKLKPGTAYTLAVRVAMNQTLRLNSVQLDYGMWARVKDNKDKELRVATIIHELGFSLVVTDLGRPLDEKRRDDLLKTVADAAEQRFKDRNAKNINRTPPSKVQKYGVSQGKWLTIRYKDPEDVARSCMVFVLWGDTYTVSVVAEFRDQDKEDVRPWAMNAIGSIRSR